MKKGVFCLSLDTELLWGRHDGNWRLFEKNALRVRPVIKKLLQLFKKYKIPATWAIVGHLFLRNDTLPGWYASDVVKAIKQVDGQEIGSHSFFHTRFGSAPCTRERAEMEIRECVRLAQKENIRLESFVFPYNSVGHLDILKKYGFICFRGDDQYSTRSPLKKIQLLVDLFMPTGSPVYVPKQTNGLIEIPGSFYFLSARGFRRYIPKNVRFRKAKRGIDRAVAEKKIFHMWTHPIDLPIQSEDLLDDIEQILAYACELRKEGVLSIHNMRQIAKQYS